MPAAEPAVDLSAFPAIDATRQDCITDEQAAFFKANGLLLIRNLLNADELRAMREQTLPLVQRAVKKDPADPDLRDFRYMTHQVTGREVPFRVEYVIDKTAAGKALLGHPFILRSIEKVQGPSFIPTWDSMVFKLEGQGAEIAWHRDAGLAEGYAPDGSQAVNVDFYLDGSDLTNCLWGILGSNLWPGAQANAKVKQLNDRQPGEPFKTDGAAPIPVNPGDVLFHSILALHGSPPAQSKLRRVVYYEFRPAPVEAAHGPHAPHYITLKQRLLQSCLHLRAQAPYARGETPFNYRPQPPFTPAPFDPARDTPPTYRYAHEDYWRDGTR